eukprot:maker-scaffold410_size180147-snap-gene-0.28 protein:Tk11881 transcript:maker-scaffold410_size180147-snap-gene-0.28-mRNA-1 annotation:"zinc finger fyve domain-containing protein 1"
MASSSSQGPSDHQGALMASLEGAMFDTDEDHARANGPILGGSFLDHGLSASLFSSTLPDVLTNELQTLSLHADDHSLSFLLLNDQEELCPDSKESLAGQLGCDVTNRAKVISIVGNTGEGKSYALNHTFFEGQEVFQTSTEQVSCTMGVCAAFHPCLDLMILDTEGMLGQGHENRRTRQLLKVLAVSDIVIYKTKAERLHSDLFYFLGDASKAYNRHFKEELKKVSGSGSSSLGPILVICHETRHTDVLPTLASGLTPVDVIRERLNSLNQDASAFSQMVYLGRKSDPEVSSEEMFEKLKNLVSTLVQDNSARSPRSIGLIFDTLQARCLQPGWSRASLGLNKKFNGDIVESHHRSFPDEYFTCPAKCSCCEGRCSKAINHANEHFSNSNCVYIKSKNNKLYLCKRCFEDGRRHVVVPKAASSEESPLGALASYAWSGDVLECSRCGVIYRSRQHWYGNETPESRAVVHTEISHMWPGTRSVQGTHNAARRMLDGVSQISEIVGNITAAPKKSAADWVANQVNPPYWRPNASIIYCHACRYKFTTQTTIHHCRACGEGFCDLCSDFQRPCPERGWPEPVRSCKKCHDSYNDRGNGARGHAATNPGEVQTRRMGEKVVESFSSFASIFQYPINVMKDSARPEYWVPDEDIKECIACRKTIDSSWSIHHCRKCGHGVCDDCSKTKKPVPHRGWDQPVRVCDSCI